MNCSAERFRHIYVEEEIRSHPSVQKILALFPSAVIIPVRRYSDVFNRPKQDWDMQYRTQNLMLANKHGSLVYPGSPVCHDFGSERFFYTASVINCLYDCDYCWLKGMYISANLVLFINLEDFFTETEELLKEGPMYLSLSFESDLVPLEHLTGHIHAWNRFVVHHPDLTAEIRTKCGSVRLYETLERCDRMIFAFTLSPETVITRHEHGTASLAQRIKAVQAAMDHGFPVRICFDPMIHIPGWKEAYTALIETLHASIPMDRVRDFSIGTYRQSDVYQRRMRRRFPDNAVVQYPYDTENGFCGYRRELRADMEQTMKQVLLRYVSEEKIFLLEDNR